MNFGDAGMGMFPDVVTAKQENLSADYADQEANGFSF
jgi:hypothetical protein